MSPNVRIEPTTAFSLVFGGVGSLPTVLRNKFRAPIPKLRQEMGIKTQCPSAHQLVKTGLMEPSAPRETATIVLLFTRVWSNKRYRKLNDLIAAKGCPEGVVELLQWS